MATEQELQILIRAQNLTTAAFNAARADLAKIGVEAKGLSGPLSGTNTQLNNMFNTLRGAAGLIGVTFGASAVIGFAGRVFDAASQIHDLALQLGISAEAVQGFKAAAQQGGSSIEAVGKSITKMNNNLAGGEKSTVEALKTAGLKFSDIRSMKPEDAFLAITDAIQKIPDPMTRTNVALALFGKSGAELLPAIKDGFRQASDAAAKMSDETVDNLEPAQQAWEDLGNKAIIVSGNMLGAIQNNLEQASRSWSDFFRIAGSLGARVAGLPAIGGLMAIDPTKLMSSHETPPASPVPPKTKEELDAAAKAAERYRLEIKAIRDELTGKGTIDAAQKMIAAMKGGVPIHQMTAENIAKVNKTMGDALDVYKATGREAPAAIHKVYLETFRLTDTIPLINRFKYELEHSADGIIPMIGVLDRAWPKTINGLERVLPIMGKVINQAGTFGTVFHDSFLKTFSSLPDILSRAFEGGGGLSGALRSLAAQIGQDFGKSMSAAIKDQLNKDSAGFTGSAFSGKTIGLSLAAGGLAGIGAASSGASTGQQIGAVASTGANVGMMAHAAGVGTAGSIAFAAYTAGAGLAVVAAYKIFKAMNDGRKAMQDYYKTFQGGSDELRKQMLVLGDEGERLWIKLTQQTGKGDKKGAQKVIAEINAALASSPAALVNAAGFQTIADLQAIADQAKKVYDYMLASGKYSASELARAWQASKDAQIAALGDTAKAQLDAIDALKKQYADAIAGLQGELDSFAGSLKAEADAPEYDEMGNRIYGVVETQQMARKKQIEDEMASLQAQSDAEVAAKQETFDAWVAAGKTADEQIREIFGKVMEIPVRFAYPEGVAMPGAPSMPGYEHGTHGEYVDFGAAGTTVRLHNRERIVTEAEGRRVSSSADAGQPIVIKIDGREIARTTARYLKQVIAPYGIR